MEGKEVIKSNSSHSEMLSFCHLIRSVDYNILSIPYRPLLIIYGWTFLNRILEMKFPLPKIIEDVSILGLGSAFSVSSLNTFMCSNHPPKNKKMYLFLLFSFNFFFNM